MKIKSVKIKNFKSIKDSGEIVFSDNLFVLAGQNESGKSSILEAIEAYENESFDKDTLNFEEEQGGNKKQEVSCTYEISDSKKFAGELVEEMQKHFLIVDQFLDVSKLEKLKNFTITKEFDQQTKLLSVKINDTALGILNSAIKDKESILSEPDGTESKIETPYLLIDDNNEKDIAEIFFSLSPQVLLFNDFSDLLPDKILISDLKDKKEGVEGYKAVKNLETLLSTTFVEIAGSSNAHKHASTSKEVTSLSVTFQNDWKQKIYGNNQVKIKFNVENDNVGNLAVPTVFFYIETKDNVPLELRKRSKGMRWFLSAWLELKAKEDHRKLVILYDEPGLYLHIKAHKDMLDVFKFLTNIKGHQIIYSTHSPSLIDTNSLHNIGLVLNTEQQGTVVEGLTTSKINTDYKQDALQPIAEAMGLEPLKDFSILLQKNVLIEGLSDFWYFTGMQKILNKNSDYKLVPGIGIKNGKINHLVSFCIGYGLSWLLIMDDGANPQNTRNELKENVFSGDENETSNKIKILTGCDGVEQMFERSDLQLLDSQIQEIKGKVKISDSRKIILARSFASKVERDEITRKNLSQTSIKKFTDIFDWIDKGFQK
ncbi:MAG: AAA family ATPase [Candidatus Paceibacterota bacterium]|jgi:predicted ATP-dependent endonuclease of OLD family